VPNLVIFRAWKSGIHKDEIVHYWLDSRVCYHRICTGADMVVCRTLAQFRDDVLPMTRPATAAEYEPLLAEFAEIGGVRRIARLPR
jgi:hypothetical protein